MRLLRRKKTKEETCAEKGHRFDRMPDAMDVALGTGGLAHTTLTLSACTRCWRAHEEWGDNSTFMTEAARRELIEMFSERGHEVFLAQERDPR